MYMKKCLKTGCKDIIKLMIACFCGDVTQKDETCSKKGKDTWQFYVTKIRHLYFSVS